MRAENREQRERMMARGARIAKLRWDDADYIQKESRRYAKTRKPCSCAWLECGNLRRIRSGKKRLTHNELLAALREQEQLNEMKEAE